MYIYIYLNPYMYIYRWGGIYFQSHQARRSCDIYIHIHVYIYKYTYMYIIYLSIYIYIYIYIYICIYIYVYTYIYIGGEESSFNPMKQGAQIPMWPLNIIYTYLSMYILSIFICIYIYLFVHIHIYRGWRMGISSY
jgi:hypothetical protein